MKRIAFTLWAAVFVAFSILHVPARSLGQNSNYLYLVPNTEDVAPLNNKTQKSAEVDAIFAAYGVTDYRQSFPKAKNERLSRVCEIHATGDITALYRELGASGLFSNVEVQSYYKVACSSPVPFNDPFLYLGSPFGTWQLDMIEAGCAWSITPGDPNVWIGICDTEFRTDHEDFAGKFAYIWNPTSWVPNCMHGTAVSSAAAANVNNNIGVAGIGNQCKIAGYVVPTPTPCFGNPWPAIWQAYQDGTKVINVSWGGVGGPTSGTLIDAIKEITQNGSTMVVAAGNTSENFHSAYAEIPGVINVTAVNHENKVGPTGMAHNGWVDICTPGGGGLVARGDAVNTYVI